MKTDTMNKTAQRIQWKARQRGWRKPAGAVYVGRGTRFGNSHDWRTLGRAEAARLYGADLLAMTEQDRANYLAPLRGKDLACWCPLGEPCHAEVLLKHANQ